MVNSPAPVLVTGIANERSLACAVARALRAQGVPVLVTWQQPRQQHRVAAVAADLGCELLGPLDVSDPQSLMAAREALGDRRLSGMLHAIAFAQLSDATGPVPVHAVDAPSWAQALEISARSLPQLLHTFLPQLNPGAGVVALTHHGARRVAPGYNLMGVAKAALEAALRYCAAELGPQGIRVNAISAGSVRTAAASAVPGFAERHAAAAKRAPLRRNVSAEDVGQVAAWLISSQASAITGAIIPVDCGEHLLA
ncbi:MAG: SDR family oxidoreductase [Planctomycetota bacterium]|nr:MAG: SDR family oxidoreductase [Planctomycetota bacterium]